MKKAKVLFIYPALICSAIFIYSIYWYFDVVRLDILFTSDGHGHVRPTWSAYQEDASKSGGLAALKSYLSKIKKQFLLLDSGDIFQGGVEGTLSKGKVIVSLMNNLGYDACVVGNHDLDFGQDNLRDLASAAEFPFMAANIIEEDTSQRPSYLEDYLIKEMNGLKIGLVGVTSEETKNISAAENVSGLNFVSPALVLKDRIKNLRDVGADIIIAMTHQGISKDIEMTTSKNMDIDVLLGGHSHSISKKVLKNNGVLIAHPGSKFKYVGHLCVYFARFEKKLISYKYKLGVLDKSKKQHVEQIDAIIDSFDIAQIKSMDDVIGSSDKIMQDYILPEYSKHGEMPLGNWITDVYRESSGADFAFQNTGGIRAPLPKGDITLRDVWEMQPFENTVVLMRLKGSQIKTLLETSVSNTYSKLQVSGLKMVYNNSLPKGQRVLNLIINTEKGVQELDLEEEYLIATNSFLAAGGDGYSVFQEGLEIKDTMTLTRNLLVDYIRIHSPVSAEYEKRIFNVSIEKIE